MSFFSASGRLVRATSSVSAKCSSFLRFAPYHFSYRYVSQEMRDKQVADMGALIDDA